MNTFLLSSFLLLPFGSSPGYLYVWSAYFFSNYSLTPCFLPLPCYTFVSLFIPVDDLTFVTLKRQSHGICNSSWDINSMGQKHTTYWKGNRKKSVWEGGSPHCPLDFKSLRVVEERAVQLNIISKEKLLWWPCSKLGGERQWHIITEKVTYIYIHTNTCSIIAIVVPFFVCLISELENFYYFFQCILILELISF